MHKLLFVTLPLLKGDNTLSDVCESLKVDIFSDDVYVQNTKTLYNDNSINLQVVSIAFTHF